MYTLSDIKAGDNVRLSKTGIVTEIYENWFDENADTYVIDDREYDSYAFTVEKLKHPKPKEGDQITGRQLKATMWKRGTLVVAAAHDDNDEVFLERAVHVLLADGDWLCTDTGTLSGFDDFYDDETVTVGFLP